MLLRIVALLAALCVAQAFVATQSRWLAATKLSAIKVSVSEEEPIENVLKRFKKTVNQSGHLMDLRFKENWETAADKKKRKAERARQLNRIERTNDKYERRNDNANTFGFFRFRRFSKEERRKYGSPKTVFEHMPELVDQETCWKLASFGELEGLQALVEKGVDMNVTDEKGFTPLNWAARNGHTNVLTYLLELGCSYETPSFGGLRPLHHACNKNAERIVKLLLKAGADVNCTDDNGDTPLHYAASRGVLNIAVALLDAGANQNPNAQGFLPIHKAAIFGQLAIIKKLIEFGANNSAQDSNMETPLHMAAKTGFPIVVKYLIDNGADVTIKNKENKLPKEVASVASIAQLFPNV